MGIAEVRELGRFPTAPGERIHFNRASLDVTRSLHDVPPPGGVSMADGIFVIAFCDADGDEIGRITERELPLPDGDPFSPEGAVEIRWLLVPKTAPGGTVVATGGMDGAPVQFDFEFLKRGARDAANRYGTSLDVVLIPPEIAPDVNALAVPTERRVRGLLAGCCVSHIDTGYGVVEVRAEPRLSPRTNPLITECHVIAYNAGLADRDVLLDELSRMRVLPGHAVLIPNVRSRWV